MKYVRTNQQMADMLTKAAFTVQKWQEMLKLHQIGETSSQKPLVSPNQSGKQVQIHQSAVLAQRETEILNSAVSYDYPLAVCVPCQLLHHRKAGFRVHLQVRHLWI